MDAPRAAALPTVLQRVIGPCAALDLVTLNLSTYTVTLC